TSGDRKEGTRVPGSTADPEVAAQIAARTQASAQRRRDFAAALLARVGTDEPERLLQRYPQPLEEISAPEIPLDVAVADLLRIDALPADEMGTDMRYAHETDSGEQRPPPPPPRGGGPPCYGSMRCRPTRCAPACGTRTRRSLANSASGCSAATASYCPTYCRCWPIWVSRSPTNRPTS